MTNTDRRGVLAAGVLLGGAVAVSTTTQAATLSPKVEVLRSIVMAWHRLDIEAVLVHVTDDIVWHNTAGFADPVRGKPAMRAALVKMKADIAENRWKIFGTAETATSLYMEGVDDFTLKSGKRLTVPYSGVYDFRGPRIWSWREYFDGRIPDAQEKGEPVSGDVAELIGRKPIF